MQRNLRLATIMTGVALVALMARPGWAQDLERMCNPVVDGDGEAVVQSDGEVVAHAGTFPCPEPAAGAAAEPMTRGVAASATIEESVVYFDFDQTEPNAAGAAALSDLMAGLQGRTPERVVIAGYADRMGSEAYNESLSRARAAEVGLQLVDAGVPARLVSTEAFGENDPAVPTEDGVAEPENRRAQIQVIY